MGTPNSVIQPMQKVQNTAARLILRAPRHQNCTPLLQQLHWFPISERIKYKTACMCYNAITGSAPSYLSELLHLYSPSRPLRSSSDTRMLKIQRFNRKTHGCALSHTSAPTSGTISPKSSGTLLLSLPSKANSRHFSSQNISVKPHCPSLLSVCTVRACVRACVRVCVCVCVCIFCIIMLEHLSIYTYLFLGITFSISMYIMCVCLFSALSRGVGAFFKFPLLLLFHGHKQ